MLSSEWDLFSLHWANILLASGVRRFQWKWQFVKIKVKECRDVGLRNMLWMINWLWHSDEIIFILFFAFNNPKQLKFINLKTMLFICRLCFIGNGLHHCLKTMFSYHVEENVITQCITPPCTIICVIYHYQVSSSFMFCLQTVIHAHFAILSWCHVCIIHDSIIHCIFIYTGYEGFKWISGGSLVCVLRPGFYAMKVSYPCPTS